MRMKPSPRRGAAVMILLVLIGLLAAFSTSMLTDTLRDRFRQRSEFSRTQRELWSADLRQLSEQGRFGDRTKTMTAEITEPVTGACFNVTVMPDGAACCEQRSGDGT